MTAEEILSIHTDIFNRALKEQDYAALEGLYAGDYMLVRPDGSVLNKQEVLQDLRSGGLLFHSIELGQTEVRMYGSTAVLTGRMPRGQLTVWNGESVAFSTDCGVCAARAVDQACPL